MKYNQLKITLPDYSGLITPKFQDFIEQHVG